MLGKRTIAHILNKMILLFPALLMLGGIALVIQPNYFIFGKDDSGWLMVYLYRYMIFLPGIILGIIRIPNEILNILYITLPTLFCLIILEIACVKFLKGDIGMKIMKLQIISVGDKPLRLTQIIFRTLLKYFVLVFIPFMLFYIFFNKNKDSLHDTLSGTKVSRKI